MIVSQVVRSSLWAAVLGVMAVVAVHATGLAGSGQALPTEALKIVSADKSHTCTVEVAATEPQRAKGLMFRDAMAADQGMLFIFDGESERHFWMKNTPLPLDIIFISSTGQIVSIAADTTPYSEKVIPSHAPAEFVLELNAGTAARLGIAAGDRVIAKSMGLNPS